MHAPVKVAQAGGGMTGRRAYLSGVVSSMANPQTFTFMVAFLPQFIDPAAGPVWLRFAILGAILIVLEFLADATVGVLAGLIGNWLRAPMCQRNAINPGRRAYPKHARAW